MSATGLEQFDHAIHTAHQWLSDILRELNWTERYQAYRALRAVLHALRDHLTVDEVAQAGAQLPTLIRGIYYEGWHPAGKPVRGRLAEDFLEQVGHELPDDISYDFARITKAVLGVVAKHTSVADSLRHCLPQGIRELWS